jgi:tetratricopeptide (TPR) repeat protein
MCLRETDHLQEATAAAQKAIHLAPDQPFGHFALATALRERNRVDEALPAIQEAIRLDPHHSTYFAVLASLYFHKSRWADALSAADQGLACDPEDDACANLRAMALVKLGRRSQAGQAISDALARDPDNPMTHANRGWTLLEEGKPKEALVHFREALRLDPTQEWAKAGIVAALKARNPVYRVALNYFLWMSKLTPRAQWGIILGAYVVYQVLRGMAESNADLQPYIDPLLILYMAFAVLTWLADPLFNLLLRLDRFGKYALSDDQVRSSNWVGACLFAAIALLATYFLTGIDELITGALAFGLLLIPVSAVHRCDRGWPRQMMTYYTLALLVLAVVAIGSAFVPGGRSSAFSPIAGLCAVFFLLGTLGSAFVANGLMAARPRK